MKSLIDQSGLVGESDFISLSKTIIIKNQFIEDKVVGTKHKLHPLASKALKKLKWPIEYRQWLEQSQKLGLSRENLDEMLLFINELGGLSVDKSLSSRIRTQKQRFKLICHGILPLALGKRFPVGVLSLGRSIFSTMTSLIISISILAILAYGVNFRFKLIWKSAVTFIAIIWTSTYIHELTHWLILKHDSNDLVILKRGPRIGLLHRSLDNWVELRSAIFGPLVGAFFAVCMSLPLAIVLDVTGLALSIGVLVALMQLISYWPTYGDGKIVWKIFGDKLG